LFYVVEKKHFGLTSMDSILSVEDVARILKVKPITVREMFRVERIRGFKVGKAWRTTEKMLQEDIDKLSRGEAPDKLPKGDGGVKPKKKAAAKAAKPEAKKKPAPAPAPAPEPKAAAKPKSAEEVDKDTTQQLLF